MIKNMIFDIGNVLVRFSPENSMIAAGISSEKIPALLKATIGTPLWLELDRGALPEDEVISMMIEKAPELSDDIHTFFDNGKLELVEAFDYAEEWLRYYKMKGYKIYLLSNYPASYFDLHLKEGRFPFMKHVDGMVVSAYVKQIKPNHDIYQTLIDKYSLIPNECVFIDDMLPNVEAAREVGIHALRFTEIEETDRRLQPLLQKP